MRSHSAAVSVKHCSIIWCTYKYPLFHTLQQGLYQKAEVLYSMGDFEYALMFYHRGHKIRPELHEFTLGIQKAEEAINNSIGCKKVILVSTELANAIVL